MEVDVESWDKAIGYLSIWLVGRILQQQEISKLGLKRIRGFDSYLEVSFKGLVRQTIVLFEAMKEMWQRTM